MIIIEDDLPRKQQPISHTVLIDDAMSTDLSSIRSGSSLDSFPESCSSRETPAPPPPSYEASIQVEQERINKRKRRQRRRIWIPAIIILNIIILLSILLPRKLKKKHPLTRHGPQWLPILDGFGLPRPPQHQIAQINETEELGSQCKSWASPQSSDSDKTNSASFTITPKTNILFNPSFCKRNQVAGSLNIIFNDSVIDSDFVLDVKAKLMETKRPSYLEVCVEWSADSVEFNHKVTGDSGFVPSVLLDLTLQLPTFGEFTVQNLTSLLTNFDHKFGDSAGGQVFDHVQIFSLASAVESKGLYAKSINISSGLKGIQGRYFAQESLQLISELSPIDVDLNLESVNGNEVTFLVKTLNSPINATLTLSESSNLTFLNDTVLPRVIKFAGNSSTNFSNPVTPYVSMFSGNITSANGPLDVSVFLDDDLDYSAITLHAETSLKPAHIRLDRRFEGSFAIAAKSSEANFEDLTINGLYEGPTRSTLYDYRGNSSMTGWTGFSNRRMHGRNFSDISLTNDLGSALVSFVSPNSGL